VKARDRLVVGVVLAVGALAGFWFMVLGPKRDEAAKLSDQVAQEQQRLEGARASMASAEQARKRYGDDYATVAKLGKAVTAQDDIASLVYQIESVAQANRIDFRSIKLEGGGGAAAAPAAAAPPAAQAADAGAQTKADPSAPAESASPAPTAGAPATQLGVAGLPPGASVGPAGFPIMPFSFNFDGSFFDMEDFLRSLDGFTRANGNRINVRGRLLTIDSITLSASRKGFPRVSAEIKSNAFLVPPGEGLTAGATPSAPGSSAPAAPSASGASATTTATVTGVTP
jgi:hypothetical protein